MSDFLLPTILVTALGLVVALIKMFNDLDKANRQFDAEADRLTRTQQERLALKTAKWRVYVPVLMAILAGLFYWQHVSSDKKQARALKKQAALAAYDSAAMWEMPDPLSIYDTDDPDLVLYGRDLIANTSDYLGPYGSVKPISNGMNCQNCHLDAGAKAFGNNYAAVSATYPKFRARSGTAETMVKRVNDCFERSLNGQPLDSTGREMRAILAYINWLGEAVPKGKTPKGTGLMKVPFLDRAASPDSGRLVFSQKCQSCHGANGQGLPIPNGNGRQYPPLWGPKSYNAAAGLYRLSNLAGYVKANMPLGASFSNPQLTDAEAWGVAAFINAQERPAHPFLKTDWPKIEKKPFDHPFGPFADSFPEIQHKFGPFKPILAFYEQKK